MSSNAARWEFTNVREIGRVDVTLDPVDVHEENCNLMAVAPLFPYKL